MFDVSSRSPRRGRNRAGACIALVGVAALVAGGCGSGSGDDSGGTAAGGGAKDAPSIYLLNAFAQDPFWQGCSKGAKTAADAVGVSKMSELDGNNSSQTQSGQIDTAIQQHPDAIMIAPLDSKAVVPQLTGARKQRIDVYAFNTAVPDAQLNGTIAMDEVATGAAAADEMIRLAKQQGLEQLTVLHLVGAVATEPVRLRRKGFDDEMAKPQDGISIKVIDQVTDWKPEKAVNALEDTLTTTDDLNAIFTESDFLTPFLVPVLKRAGFKPESGKRPIIGGLGGIPGGFRAIRDGWQDFTLNYPIDGMCNATVRLATDEHNGDSYADQAMGAAHDAGLDGADPRLVENADQGPSILLTANLVDKSNVDDPALWANKLRGGE
jgi:ribose transport system substrate-binding protein